MEAGAGASPVLEAASAAPAAAAAAAAPASSSARLSRARLLAYSAAAISIDMVVVPITAVLPTFYAKNTKASLAAIGVWLVVTRIFDAVSDQAIGFWSDRTGGRLGPRKPWILAGAVVTMLSVVFLFRPTADTGVTYFGVWALIFYLGYTMMNIPYIAWGAELSNDYRERSRIVTWRMVAGAFGGILFLGAPFLLPFDTTEMNAQVLSAVAWATLILIPVTVAITCIGVPSAAPVVGPARTPILVLLRSVLGNKPFQRYLYVFILGAIQLGFYATLLLMFLDSYLGIGAKFSHIMAATAVVSWLATPLWLQVTNRWGKHRPWAWSLIASSVGLMLFVFVEPGPGAFWPALVISCLCGALGACGAVAPPSILADIVEYDRWKSGEDRAGNYFAFHLMVVKLAVAVAGGFSFLVLDWFGFDPKATTHDATARLGMLLAFVLVPNLLQLLSVFAVWNFPIDERAQRIVRRRLEQREARMAKAKEAHP